MRKFSWPEQNIFVLYVQGDENRKIENENEKEPSRGGKKHAKSIKSENGHKARSLLAKKKVFPRW
jgi:hypothetical protein